MKLRLTILGLMGLIVFAAGGLAAIRTASALCASSVFTAAFLATTIAAIAVLATRGRARSTSGGFALACGAYIGLVFGPLASASGLKPPPLLTTLIFNWTASRLGEPAKIFFVDGPENSLDNASAFYLQSSENLYGTPPEFERFTVVMPAPSAPSPPQNSGETIFLVHHLRIGHSLMGIVIGLGGAVLGYWLFGKASSDSRVKQIA